jgi:egghead protein (zeste-white 4 protein)
MLLPIQILVLAGYLKHGIFSKRDLQLECDPVKVPHFQLRVVTKGDYPELIENNLAINIKACLAAGAVNFGVDIVTEKRIGICTRQYLCKVREIVVPKDYVTWNGTLFKARNLQYAISDNVNELYDDDWIVHLDEDTVVTKDSIVGIMNFISDGKADLGQGITIYGHEQFGNLIARIADFSAVGDHVGRLTFELATLNYNIHAFKGSYVVVPFRVERDISFDFGIDGSVVEDSFFSMIAGLKGYKYGFIQGEMNEKSAPTFIDYFKQRKRWAKGNFMLIHSSKVSIIVI